MRTDRRKIKEWLPKAVIVLTMTVGSLISLFSAVDATGFRNSFSSPWNSLLLFENAFLQFLTRKTGRIYLLFDCVQNRDYIFVIVAIAALFAFLTVRAVRTKRIYAALVPVVLLTAGYVVGFLPSTVGFALFSLGFLLLLTECAGGKSFWFRFIALGVCFALVFTTVSLVHISAPKERLLTGMHRAIHTAKYENNDPLQEGQLRKDATEARTDEGALTLHMDKPQNVYLRGFVGEKFNGEDWTLLDNETLARYSDLFYWLHEYGFYSTAQTALALDSVGKYKAQNVEVTNLSACRQYAFLPSICKAESLTDPMSIREGMDAQGVSHQVQMPVYDKTLIFSVQKELAETTKRDTLYLRCERAYADFVYETMLDIPDSTREAMDRQISDEIREAGLGKKVWFVLKCLEIYNQTPSPMPYSGKDAVVWFLEQSRTGDDAMFATASVMLLRYLGIPARYAEGYSVNPDKTEYTVKRSDAHAWAEYYLDGMGWIPLETIPELNQKEKQFYEQTAPKEEPLNDEDFEYPTDIPEQGDEDPVETPSMAIFLAGTGGLLLLIFAAVLLLRRLLFQKKMRTIREMEPKNRIPALYAYARYVQAKCEAPVEDEKAEALQKEALFSNHRITEDHAQKMEDYVQKSVEACKQTGNKWTEIRRKFWDNLY